MSFSQTTKTDFEESHDYSKFSDKLVRANILPLLVKSINSLSFYIHISVIFIFLSNVYVTNQLMLKCRTPTPLVLNAYPDVTTP